MLFFLFVVIEILELKKNKPKNLEKFKENNLTD